MVRNDLDKRVMAAVNALSSYNGSDMEQAANDVIGRFTADELVMLTSGGSDLIGFGNVSEVFKAQMQANRVFQLTVTGHATADETLYLNPSARIAEGDNGHPLSGKGIGGNPLTISGNPGGTNALKNFFRMLAKTPYNVVGLKLNSSDATQLNQPITVKDYPNGPFNDGISNTIFPALQVDEYSQRTDMITIVQQFSFDYNTDIIIPILATKSVTIVIVMGARLDTAQALQKAATKALEQNQQPRQLQQTQLGAFPNLQVMPKTVYTQQVPVMVARPGAKVRILPAPKR